MSTETVNICESEPVAVIIMGAVATFVKDAEFQEKFAKHGPIATVELFVNGHRVPVVESLADCWRRCDKVLEARARKMAVEMVTAAGLEPLANALRDAETKIREKLGVWDE